MLTHLKKLFNPALAEIQKEVVMTTQEGQSAGDTNTAELSAQLASATESLSVAQTALAENEQKFAELTSKFAEAQAALATIEAEKASLVATAAAAKLEARKQRIEATIGTAKAASVMAATESLDDASFDAVVGAFAASLEVEERNFAEVGVTSAEAVVEPKPAHFNDYINK